MKRSWARAGAAALAVIVAAPGAVANGRFPAAQHVVVGRGGAAGVVALRTTFGVALSRDAGATFRWLCEESLFAGTSQASDYDAPLEVTAAGDVVYALAEGARATRDGCAVRDLPGAAARAFVDLTTTPDGATVFAVESGLAGPAAVHRAGADGLGWQRLGPGLPNVYFDTLEVAPSDARRLYLSGRAARTFEPGVYRSDDGGATLAPVAGAPRGADQLWVSGVHPRDPAVLFVRASVGLGSALHRSRDGGATFERVASTADPMLGFALSDDGASVWYGSAEGGLHRSDDGGDTFRPVSAAPVHCLRYAAGALWACADWTRGGVALARSTDGGATFAPALRLDDARSFAGPADCGGEGAAAACARRWPEQRALLTPRGADAGARDAGAGDAGARGGAPASGGGCDVARGGRSTGWGWWALAALGGARRASRRRRAPGRRAGQREIE